MHKRSRRALIAVVVSTATAIASLTLIDSGYAADNGAASEVAATVADASPVTVQAVPVEHNAGGTFTSTADNATVLPADGDGSVSLGDTGVSVQLPPQASDDAGQAAGTGTVVYGAHDGDAASTAVTPDANGVQIATVADDADEASDGFSYSVEGAQPIVQDDGSIALVVRPDDPDPALAGVGIEVARIDAPWAVDAAGYSVPTRYEITGDTITQTVKTDSSTQFPVVADPKVSLGTTIYVDFNHLEMVEMVTVIAGAGIIAAGAACTYYGTKLSKVPGLKVLINFLCGWVSAKKVYNMIMGLPSWAASYYTSYCYRYRFAAGPEFYAVGDNHCAKLQDTWKLTY